MDKSITKELFSRADIELAWERVCSSVGNDVKDYFGINIVNQNISKYLDDLYETLSKNDYKPTKPFKYFEPKKCGTQRTKTVLRINDALIYQAIADKIAYKLYDQLSETKNNVFGSVLNDSVLKGTEVLEEDEPVFYFFEYYVNLYNRFIEGVNTTLESGEARFKLETDITAFFDCIPHSVLLLKLHENGVDSALLDLLSVCLNTWSGTRDSITLHVGIPQGPPASFLLANVLLDGLDRVILKHELSYFRFMDDIRIYASSEEELLNILVTIDRYLKGYSLSLNTSKTAIKSVEIDDEEDDLFLDSSGIPFDEILLEDNHEVIVQDETQLTKNNTNENTLNKESTIKLQLKIISILENELLELFSKYKTIDRNKVLSHETVRQFLTLSQRWRALALPLKDVGKYTPNIELIKVWLFGVEHIFWKTNSMVWNLKLYDSLESHSHDYENIIENLSRFEWVKYQMLSIFYKVYTYDQERHKQAIEELKNETSPLIRLGYYSVLIESIKDNTVLFESYGSVLKHEKDEYIKEAVLSAIHYKHMQVSIDNLRKWFLK